MLLSHHLARWTSGGSRVVTWVPLVLAPHQLHRHMFPGCPVLGTPCDLAF